MTFRRIATGLIAALLVGGGLLWLLVGLGAAAENQSREQREAVVTLRAATEMVGQAGASRSQAAAIAFAAGRPELRVLRVVNLEERSLEVSTAPEDTGERAAPRKLQRDEKALFDEAQRLRTAVATNREGSGPPSQEIAIEEANHETLALAGPLERDGKVVGMVRLDLARSRSGGVPWPPLLPLGLALGLGIGAGLALRRWPAAQLVVAGVALVGALAWASWEGQRDLALRAQQSGAAVAARATVEAGRATAALGTAGAPATVTPAAWDTDLFRRPWPSVAAPAGAGLDRLALGAGVLALALLLWWGLGGAARFWQTLRRHRVAYAYTLPAMLGMLLLVFFPFFYGLALSFTNANIYNSNKPISEIWIGLQNFKEILGDFSFIQRTAGGVVFNYASFYWTLLFNIVWTISNVAYGVGLGLILALILNTKGLALRPVYRVLLILPWAMPNYITALIWKGMFHRQFGVINQIIQMAGGTPLSWFDKPFTSFLTVFATNGWLSFPFLMVVSLGALQSIPGDLYEAARVDGATRWQQFRSITLPSLRPALVPAIILSVIWTFNQFNIIYLVSEGEPSGSTEILITGAYKLAFQQYRYGYAAAYSTVIFLILFAYGTWQNHVTKATEGL